MRVPKQVLDEIASVEGSGTQLVSLYVPGSKSVQSVTNRLRSEHAEAENIKSKQTRENVQRAITMTLNALTTLPDDWDGGLVIFAGVDTNGEEFRQEILDVPVESFRYHCDSSFMVEPLRELVRDDDTYGLIVVERRAGTVGRLVGDSIERVRDLDSDAKGKHSAGGFSDDRFDRLIEESTDDFYDDLAQAADDSFGDVDGVLVGGTNITKDEFVSHLPHRLEQQVLGTFAVEYHGEGGLKELVRKADETITDARQETARRSLNDFFTRLRTDDPVVYGPDATARAADMGAIETLLIAPEKLFTEDTDCPDIAEQVEELGGSVVEVPGTFEDGSRFRAMTDGIGAICRYDPG